VCAGSVTFLSNPLPQARFAFTSGKRKYVLLALRFSLLSQGRFTLHKFFLKLSHATCLQLELYCVN
jgi:hypothetical protein